MALQRDRDGERSPGLSDDLPVAANRSATLRSRRFLVLAVMVLVILAALQILLILQRTRQESRANDVDVPYPIATARPTR